MATKLDDLLALLPDNDTGEITAATMREVMTGMWEHVWIATDYPYYWRPGPPSEIGSQEVGISDWSETGTTVYLAPSSIGGTATPRDLLNTPGTQIRVEDNETRNRFLMVITGPLTEEQGNGTTVLVLHGTVRQITGPGPLPDTGPNMTVVVLSPWEE